MGPDSHREASPYTRRWRGPAKGLYLRGELPDVPRRVEAGQVGFEASQHLTQHRQVARHDRDTQHSGLDTGDPERLPD